MNILYFAHIPIYPEGHGNIATVIQYINRLKNNGHKVHYVYYNESRIKGPRLFMMQDLVDTLDVIKHKAKRKRHKDGYYYFDSWYYDGLGEQIANLCKLYKADIIICTYVMYSKILEFVPQNIVKIIDTHDRMTDRHLFLRKNKIKDEFFSCTQEDEAKYLSRADIIWARNDNETKYFNEITNSNKAITVSHFNNPHFLNKNCTKIKKFGYLASNNNVNVALTTDFIEKFCKKYKSNPIDIELNIAGAVKTRVEKDKKILKLIQKYPIKLLGKIPDVIDFYKDIDLVICPVTFGTGINVKMIEAMSFGIPVMSTECGIKGIESPSKFHHNKDADELLNILWNMYDKPDEIQMLTNISINLFKNFYERNAKAFDDCFKEHTLV